MYDLKYEVTLLTCHKYGSDQNLIALSDNIFITHKKNIILMGLTRKENRILPPLSLSLTHTHTYIYIYIYINKINCSHYRPGVAQRVGRDIALLFHDRGTRRAVVSSTPQPHFTPGKDTVPFLQDTG